MEDVRRHRAAGDGTTNDTPAVQHAIETAAHKGGGTVLVPPGRYVVGTIHLRSHITLRLESGAVLVASKHDRDFDPFESLPYTPWADQETAFFHHAVLAGEDLTNVAVVGEGTIDGNRHFRGGPKTVALKRCRSVSIRGVTIVNAPNYAVSFLGCEYVDVDRVTIRNGYADGIDPDCSRFVHISNCHVDTRDDAICLKTSLSLGERRATEHVTVANCTLRTFNNHLKLGTESSGDFADIAFSNCTMLGRPDLAAQRGPSDENAGIAIESVDGAHIRRVTVSNITMRDVLTPVFVRLGNRGRGMDAPLPGSLEDVSISHVRATGAADTSSITGIPGARVRHVTLSDVRIRAVGGEPNAPASLDDVPEVEADYPQARMFGTLPASGLYCRHTDRVVVRDLSLHVEQPDRRPGVVVDDSTGIRLESFSMTPKPEGGGEVRAR
jgi:polygalacturonase